RGRPAHSPALRLFAAAAARRRARAWGSRDSRSGARVPGLDQRQRPWGRRRPARRGAWLRSRAQREQGLLRRVRRLTATRRGLSSRAPWIRPRPGPPPRCRAPDAPPPGPIVSSAMDPATSAPRAQSVLIALGALPAAFGIALLLAWGDRLYFLTSGATGCSATRPGEPSPLAVSGRSPGTTARGGRRS